MKESDILVADFFINLDEEPKRDAGAKFYEMNMSKDFYAQCLIKYTVQTIKNRFINFPEGTIMVDFS